MKVTNKSRKIIGINGDPFLPGASLELPEGFESHPAIADYLKKGMIVDEDKEVSTASSGGINDSERAKIAEEAIAQYKKEQEALAAAQAEKEAEMKEVQSMKKTELLKKAAGMGLEVADDDTVEILKEKIVAALNQ